MAKLVPMLLLTAKQLQMRLGISQSTFYRLKARGDLPPAIMIGRKLYWQPATVLKWLVDREQPASIDPVYAARGRTAALARKSKRKRKPGRPPKKESVENPSRE